MPNETLTVEEFRDALRTNILKARGAKTYTQSLVSSHVGMSIQGYQKIEAGITTPSSMTLHKLSLVLGINIDQLYPSKLQVQRAIQRRNTSDQ